MTKEEFATIYDQGVDPCWSEFQKLIDRNAVLEGQLKANSSNSHFPSSRDLSTPKRNAANNSREKSGRKPGGQEGHKGHTLDFTENPKHMVQLIPKQCSCGHCFNGEEEIFRVERRQEFDIPMPIVEVTEYQAITTSCPKCGKNNKADFPERIVAPVQYGPNIQTLAVDFHANNFVPYQRSADFIHEWCGIKISAGTLRNFIKSAGVKSQPIVKDIKHGVILSNVAHFDETGSRNCGIREWNHVASTIALTYYFHHARRGQEAMEAMGILPFFLGVAVHDYWKAYYAFLTMSHSQCCAHLLRDSQGVHDIFGFAWARKMKQLLKDGKILVNSAKLEGQTELPAEKLTEYKKQYDQIILDAKTEMPPPPEPIPGKRGRVAKGKAHCLVDRFENSSDEILRFMNDFDVPFDNNLAERDIRMDKLKQKVSGGFRSDQGAKDFCDLRSIISTARKQLLGGMRTIRDLISGNPIQIQT